MMASARAGVSKFMEKPGRKAMVAGGALMFTGFVAASATGGLGVAPGLTLMAAGAFTAYSGYKDHKASQSAMQQGLQASQGPLPQPYAGMGPGPSLGPQAAPSVMAHNQRRQSRDAPLTDEQYARRVAASEFAKSVKSGHSPQAHGDWDALSAQKEAMVKWQRSAGRNHSATANGGEQTSRSDRSLHEEWVANWARADGSASSPVPEDKRDSFGNVQTDPDFSERRPLFSGSSVASSIRSSEDAEVAHRLYDQSNFRDSPGARPVITSAEIRRRSLPVTYGPGSEPAPLQAPESALPQGSSAANFAPPEQATHRQGASASPPSAPPVRPPTPHPGARRGSGR